MKYVDVAIDNRSRATDCFYTYRCTFDEVSVGSKVYVPFGRGNKPRGAYVFAVKTELDKEILGIKDVEAVDAAVCLNSEMIDTCRWMRNRYLCKYIDGVNCFTPAGNPPKRKPKAEKEKPVCDGAKQLTEEQQAVMVKLEASIDSGKKDIFLLRGVTSSGKTEVYMQSIAKCLRLGKTAIFLVPEIALTKQIVERFTDRFGSNMVAVLHSGLSKGRRFATWQRIRNGDARVVIGARSAVFAPLENIGIIIMDEEHETTYKSDMTPKYETVDVALKRVMAYDGVLLLGSATPSVVSTRRAVDGIYKILELKKRYNSMPLPHVSIVDMREELRSGNREIFSGRLYEETRSALEAGRQIIFFLNRRGFSPFISCRECGYVMKCPVCGISLTYHKSQNAAVCHFCGHMHSVPVICPKCGDKHIKKFGVGTEKLEEEVHRFFPEVSVDRLDTDSISRKGSLEKVLNDFAVGKTDILIGTQLVAKGLDFDNIGLVGIIAADTTLNIPDFRASERTFQLITQAAGRSGRGDFRGQVIVQTYDPENYAIKAARAQDYDMFYEAEIKLRNFMNYPPFCDIIQVIFSGVDEAKTEKQSKVWYRHLKAALGTDADITLFEPQPAPMNKIKDTYRYRMLLKAPKGKRNTYMQHLQCLRTTTEDKRSDVLIDIDINPYSFL